MNRGYKLRVSASIRAQRQTLTLNWFWQSWQYWFFIQCKNTHKMS